MVYYSKTAENDLHDILIGLATWKKISLSFEEAERYVRDIRKIGDTICKLSFHSNARYEIHRTYGEKICRYMRSKQTQWYIIYDWDEINKIAYVNKIMSNHTTVSEIND